MAAHTRSITATCSAPGCTKSATVEVYTTWNDPKGWRWTGAERELCRACLGSGSPRSIEHHARGPMPQVADPIKSRVR